MKFGSILLSSALILSSFHGAANAAGVDLKQNMQQMKLEFRHAAEAQDISSMQAAVTQLQALVESSKRGIYPAEKDGIYQEGFNKLSVALSKIDQELKQGDLQQAKQALREIDQLREEYHDKRNPSIWSKLFG
ncbi:cytochrome b562 [Vibrio navarrensis]